MIWNYKDKKMNTKYNIGEVVEIKEQLTLSSGTQINYKSLFTIRSILIDQKDIAYCNRESGIGEKIYEKDIVCIKGWSIIE